MYGAKGSTQKSKKALHCWKVLHTSHLVATSFGLTLLGGMLAEVRDMADDIRVKAGRRCATFNFTLWRRNTSLFLPLSFFLSAWLIVFLCLSMCLHVYTSCSDELKKMRVCVPGILEGVLLLCLIFQNSNQQFHLPRAKGERIESLLFGRGYMN